jgi:hypothetical protein
MSNNTQNDTATIRMTTDIELGRVSFRNKKNLLTRRVRVKSEEEGKNVDVKKEKNKNS